MRKYEKCDLHIHVPEGAVPKDGPSAGITLTTAIASLVTDRAVAPSYAMTGEVSLRGAVTAIGGLPEKLMAAQRAGITTVFIPKENEARSCGYRTTRSSRDWRSCRSAMWTRCWKGWHPCAKRSMIMIAAGVLETERLLFYVPSILLETKR